MAMVKLAEYGTYGDEHRSTPTMLVKAPAAGFPNRTIEFSHHTAGFEPAGSVARWTDGYWRVGFMLDGAQHGRRFGLDKEADARALFAKWTGKEI